MDCKQLAVALKINIKKPADDGRSAGFF